MVTRAIQSHHIPKMANPIHSSILSYCTNFSRNSASLVAIAALDAAYAASDAAIDAAIDETAAAIAAYKTAIAAADAPKPDEYVFAVFEQSGIVEQIEGYRQCLLSR